MSVDLLSEAGSQIAAIFQQSYLYLWLSGGEVNGQVVVLAFVATSLLALTSIAIYWVGLLLFRKLQQRLVDKFAQYWISLVKKIYFLVLLIGFSHFAFAIWGIDFTSVANFHVLVNLIKLVVKILVIVMFGLVVWYLLHEALIKASKVGARRGKTLFYLAQKALKTVVATLVGLTILQTLGIDIAFLITGLGIFGLSIGLASQKLIRDFINCFLFVSEDAVQLGDVVQIKDMVGTVELLNFRTVRLRTLSGEIHVIPYSMIDSLTNLTPGKREMALLDLAVGYEQDLDQIVGEVQTVFKQLTEDETYSKHINGDLIVVGVNQLGESTVTARFLIPTVSKMKWSVTRELYRRIKKHFDAKQIAFPYPKQEIALQIAATEEDKGNSDHAPSAQ